MPTKHIYLCDNSIDGIFSAIYACYESRYGHNNNAILISDGNYNRELFSEYFEVTTDNDKAIKVAHTITTKISSLAMTSIQRACASYDMDKANVVYHTVVLGLNQGPSVLDHLSHPSIIRLFELQRNVNNEIMHLHGFLRFKELKDHTLFAKINPKNDILPFISQHFADRFPSENWVITDTIHHSTVFHQKDKKMFFLNHQEKDMDNFDPEYSDDELFMQHLWKHFTDTIAIDERTNKSLQQQNLPLRFRKYMSEFN